MRALKQGRLWSARGILLAFVALFPWCGCGLAGRQSSRFEAVEADSRRGGGLPESLQQHAWAESQSETTSGAQLLEMDALLFPFGELATTGTIRIALEGAINRALLENRGITDAREQVQSAGYTLISAESAFELKIVPSARSSVSGGSETDTASDIGAGFRLEQQFDWGTRVSVGPRTSRMDAGLETWQSGMDFSLRQPLLKGLGREVVRSGVYGAEYSARSARRSLYRTQVSTVVSAVENVYSVIRQRELARLHQEAVERLSEHVESVRAKEQLGLISPIDAYRAAIQLKQAEDNLVTAREAWLDALDNLKILLNIPQEQEIEVVAPLVYDLFHLDENEAVRIALAERVEILQAEDTVQEADRLARVAKQNILPDLDLLFSYSRFGVDSSFGDSWGMDQDAWTLGLRTTADVARTAERAGYRQSLLNVRSAERQMALTRDNVARQVKQSARGLRRAEHRIRLQQEQIQQAESQLELARVKYNLGKAGNFDVIEAEIQLQRAQTNLVSVVIEYITETYRVRAVMGTLLEKPETF